MLHIEHIRTRSRALAASAGAVILALGGAAVAASAAPKVAVSVRADVEMAYHWAIQQHASTSSLGNVQPGSQHTINYTVTATPGEYQYNKASLVGTINLTNPSSTDALSAELTVVSSDAAWACQAAEPTPLVPAGKAIDVPFDCVLSGDAEPNEEGSINVEVTADGATSSGSAPYVIKPTATNRSITLESLFNGGEAKRIGTATWAPGGKAATFQLSRTLTASREPGNHEATSVARIIGTGQQAATSVTYTVEKSTPKPTPSAPPTVAPEPSQSPSPDIPRPTGPSSSPSAAPTSAPTTAPTSPKRPSPGMPPTGV